MAPTTSTGSIEAGLDAFFSAPTAPLATPSEAVAVAIAERVRGGRHSVWVPGATRWS